MPQQPCLAEKLWQLTSVRVEPISFCINIEEIQSYSPIYYFSVTSKSSPWLLVDNTCKFSNHNQFDNNLLRNVGNKSIHQSFLPLLLLYKKCFCLQGSFTSCFLRILFIYHSSAWRAKIPDLWNWIPRCRVPINVVRICLIRVSAFRTCCFSIKY